MALEGDSTPLRRPNNASRGSYVLRKLVDSVPLSADGEAQDARITCVELCGKSLEALAIAFHTSGTT